MLSLNELQLSATDGFIFDNIVLSSFLVIHSIVSWISPVWCRLIVLLKEQTYIYDVNSLEIKQIIDTVPNVQGQFEIIYIMILNINLFTPDLL